MSRAKIAGAWLFSAVVLGAVALAWAPLLRPWAFAHLPDQPTALEGWLLLDRSGRDWWGRELRYFEYSGVLSPGADGVYQSEHAPSAVPSTAAGDDVLLRRSSPVLGQSLVASPVASSLYLGGAAAAWLGSLCLAFAALSQRPSVAGRLLGGRRFLAECVALAIAVTCACEALGAFLYRDLPLDGVVHEALWVATFVGAGVAAALYSLTSEELTSEELTSKEDAPSG